VSECRTQVTTVARVVRRNRVSCEIEAEAEETIDRLAYNRTRCSKVAAFRQATLTRCYALKTNTRSLTFAFEVFA
jgi:hypothetical protein